MPNIDFLYNVTTFQKESTNFNGVTVNQGQNNSLEFRFYFNDYTDPNNPTTVLTETNMIDRPVHINAERPDTSSSNNIATTAVTDGTPPYFKLAVGDWFTAQAGTLRLTAKRYNPSNETYEAFGVALINVVASASTSSDTITTTQYNALTSYLATTGSGSLRTEVRANEAISALDLVMFTGSLGSSGKLLVSKATQTGTPNIKDNPEYKFGLAVSSASQNENFFVQQFGIIDNVDTSSFAEGKVLVPSGSVAGGLVAFDDTNAPVAPFNRTPIAVCIKSHQTQGIIIVRPTIFPRIGQVKDVFIDYNNLSQGQTLVWDTSEARFKTGFSGGVFYDENLPAEADRFVNLTYFDV